MQPNPHKPLISLGAITIVVVIASLIISVPSPNFALRSISPAWNRPLGTSPYGHDLLGLTCVLSIRAVAEAIMTSIATWTLSAVLASIMAVPAMPWPKRVVNFVTKLLETIGPFLLILCIVSAFGSVSSEVLVVLVSVAACPATAMLLTEEAELAKRSPETEAAIAIGCPPLHIAAHHIFPSMLDRVGPYLFASYLGFIALYGTLDFVGVRRSSAESLGYAVFDSTHYLRSTPWYFWSCFTGFIISLLLSVVAATACGLRILDPFQTFRR